MGMYTTVSVPQSHTILSADGPSITILDPDQDPDSLTSSRSHQAWIDLFSGYWWENGSNVHTWYEAERALDYQITMGALPNSHPLLNNLDDRNPSIIPYDDSMVPRDGYGRVVDPGAGAFSYYMGRDSVASRDIEAGEEIFLEYPSEYMDWVSEKYNVPNERDYYTAGRRLSSFLNLYEGEKIAYGNGTSSEGNKTRVPLVWSGSKKAKSLLPTSQSDLDQILISSKHSYDPKDLTLAIAKTMSVQKRSVEWIEEHGICLENIMPGPSTVHTKPGSQSGSSGKGAIAQRQLSKGSVIAPAPLLQITDRDALRIPAFSEQSNQMQILLNYCFGRDDSSLLLCPNTNVILINHCSARRPDLHPCSVDVGTTEGQEEAFGPNAKYIWATWDDSTEEWLSKTIEEMKQSQGRGLSLEIVATREIREGEEVFIDYGESWELAWDQHLEQWNKGGNETSASYAASDQEWKSVKKWNEELAPITPTNDLTDVDICANDGGPIFTGCLYDEYMDEYWDTFEDIEWTQLTVAQIMEHYKTPANGNYEIDDSFPYTDDNFWPCVVFQRDESNDNTDVNDDYYTVRIIQSPFSDFAPWHDVDQPRIITNYPRKSIRHFYKPYESDLHLPNAFRHHIELRDEITPEQWKDIR